MKKLVHLCLFIVSIGGYAQKSVTEKLKLHQEQLPFEKLYLSFDKTRYAAGDTIWFKAYLLDPAHKASQISDKVYIELYSDKNKLTERLAIKLNNGLGYGNITLKTPMENGTYLLRAYTKWQQNFGEDLFFSRSFSLGQPDKETWMGSFSQKTSPEKVNMTLQINNSSAQKIGFKEIEYILENDKKRIAKGTLTTDRDGIANLNVALAPDVVGAYTLTVVEKSTRKEKLSFPVLIDAGTAIDLQFMPEGGYLVNGIYTKVGVKSIGADGFGKTVSGKIVDANDREQAVFQANKYGMGSFFMLPQKGMEYFATYQLNGKTLKQRLTRSKDEGTTLRVDAHTRPDSVMISIKASPGKALPNYQLIAQGEGKTVVAFKLNLTKGFFNIKLPHTAFPAGVINFTLLSPSDVVLNERVIFLPETRKINLKIAQNTPLLAAKDSVSFEIEAKDEAGNPLRGAFSVAVTDDNTAPRDKEASIGAYFQLQSVLKGNIEDIDQYFTNTSPEYALALDDLLLTQAWVGHNWESIARTPDVKFSAEKGNDITGTTTNLLKNPIADLNVTLLSMGGNLMVTDTVSDKSGRFTFKDLPIIDSPAYLIKIKKKTGGTSTADIFVDDFTPSPAPKLVRKIMPWNINTLPADLSYYRQQLALQQQAEIDPARIGGTAIKAVEIKEKRQVDLEILRNVHQDVSYFTTITKEELMKIPRKSLVDMLYEKVKGFRISARGKFNIYTMEGGIIDGMRFDGTSITNEHSVGLLPYFNAEDIIKLDIYRRVNIDAGLPWIYYFEFTTRSGNGPHGWRAIGNYVYRPYPIHIPKEFYTPKYTIADKKQADLRSTIFWEANLVTDANGKARVSFYAADNPQNYTLKVEGTDMQGRFGWLQQKITFKPRETSK